LIRRAYISLPLLFFLLIGISAHTNGKNLVSSKTDPTGTVSYGYDDSGFLETVTEGGTTITRSYDERGRLKTYTNADGALIQYGYDSNNNLTRLTYPDGKQVNYTYNARNLLATVTDWAGRTTTYQYDRIGRLTGTIRPNGTANQIVHDAASQLTSIKETANGKLISYLKFDQNAAGQITRRFRAPLVNSGWQQPSFSATYDDDNRLASINGQSITHDADGNMTFGPIRHDFGHLNLTYNTRNQLTNADGISYAYDAEGQRRTITDANGTIRDVIDPSGSLSRLLVRHNANSTKTYYVYGLGLLYEVDQAGKTKTHHYDQVGSTIFRTDDTGKVIGSAEYSAYGVCYWKQGDMATPFLYNGQAGVQTDSNGLLHMRARYYSPYLMRFLNADPIGFSGGMNWFAYADGNPISLSDPFGLCAGKNACTGGYGYGNAGTAGNVAMLSTITQIAFGFSPIGPLMDGADFIENYNQGSGGGMAMAAVGLIPGGDLLKLRKLGNVGAAANEGRRLVQTEFAFARGASVQTPGVTTAGETFVRAGAAPQNLKFGSTSLSGAQPGTYAFPEATFNSIGQSSTALKNFGDLPGAAPQYFRTLSPPAGTPIQRGIVPGGEFGGAGGMPEVIFPKGF
jgi:RHS repeat-associated protein